MTKRNINQEMEILRERECLKMASKLNYTVSNYLSLVESFNFDFVKIYSSLAFHTKQQEEN